MASPFDPHSRVSAQTAKQDKIEVRVGSWLLSYPDDENRTMFVQALGRFPQQVTVVGEPTAIPRLFMPSEISDLRWQPQAVQVGRPHRANTRASSQPLFSGELTMFHGGRDPQSGLHQNRIRLDLSLNPTRYVRYQGNVSNISRPPSQWEMGRARLERTTPAWVGEVTLDGNDNVLGSPRMERLGCPEAWPLHVSRYWASVTGLFSAMFSNSARETGCILDHVQRCTVSSVETYWEFRSEDALLLVRRLEPHLRSYAAESTTHEFSISSEKNALSIRLRLRVGVYLRVYAKTRTRVRFEIEHRLGPSRVRPAGGATGDLASFPRVLEFCARQAAVWVNGVLDHLSQYIAPGEYRSVYELLHRIVRVSEPSAAEAILSLLVNQGGRIALGRGDTMRPIVRALIEARVLRRSGAHRNTFAVAPEYAFAIAQLRGQARMHFPLPT